MTKSTIVQLVAMGAAAALFYFLGHRTAATVLCSLAAVVLVLAVVAPGALHTLQELIERLVGWFASTLGLVLLTVVYFTVFLPGALWLRLRRVDLLNRAFPGRGKSNWIERIDYGTDNLLYQKPYTRPHGRGGDT
jgi:hypothetical protein